MNEKDLHVVLATDNNYAEFVAVVIVSLLQTNPQFESIHVHLLANGVNDATIQKLQHHLLQDRAQLHVYDISDLEQRLGIQVPNSIAISAYARLFMASLLPTDLDRVLYLDCDVVVSDDITSFWEMNIEGFLIAGVLDTLSTNRTKTDIGLPTDAPYVNSGVLLINLKSWREENMQQCFLDFLLSHNGHVTHHDQGIINATCHGRIQIVHPRFNLASNYLSHPYKMLASMNTPFYSENEVEEAKKYPAIIHFTQGFYNRPWVKNSMHPLVERVNYFHKQTEWDGTPLRPDKRSLAMRILSWVFLNLPLWMYNATQRIIKKIK